MANPADRRIHRYAIATFLFRSVLPPERGGIGSLPWSHDLINEVFVTNTDSVRNYWRRATSGLVEPQFDIVTGIFHPFDEYGQAEAQGRGGRNRTLDAARAFLSDNDISIAGYDHLIAVVPNTPTDAGATGPDIAFDLAGASLPFLQHEIGHTLGFQHSFGPFQPDQYGSLYKDPYDVMGLTDGNFTRYLAEPARFAGQVRNGPAFWRSERRLSAASLWRHSENYKLSGRVEQVLGPLGGSVELHGLSADSPRPITQLAVVNRPRHADQQITVEYRPQLGDDDAVTSAVVIHSFGAHDVGAGRGEVRPAWFEAAIPDVPGSVANILGVRVKVAAVNPSPPPSITVDITLVPQP